MVNQSVIDSSVNLEQLKDIEDLIPNIDKAISYRCYVNVRSGKMNVIHGF